MCLKKNQTTPRLSEHPPVMGEKMSKRLGGIKRLFNVSDSETYEIYEIYTGYFPRFSVALYFPRSFLDGNIPI